MYLHSYSSTHFLKMYLFYIYSEEHTLQDTATKTLNTNMEVNLKNNIGYKTPKSVY